MGQYVSDIHEEKMPLEMSLYEVYGALVALEDTIELPLEIKSAENMTKDQGLGIRHISVQKMYRSIRSREEQRTKYLYSLMGHGRI